MWDSLRFCPVSSASACTFSFLSRSASPRLGFLIRKVQLETRKQGDLLHLMAVGIKADNFFSKNKPLIMLNKTLFQVDDKCIGLADG